MGTNNIKSAISPVTENGNLCVCESERERAREREREDTSLM